MSISVLALIKYLQAVFSASFTVPSNRGLTVLFNSPEVAHSEEAAGVTFMFAETKNILSTYLVAFAIGRFDFVEQLSPVQNITMRVYTPPGASRLAAFALNVRYNCMLYFRVCLRFVECEAAKIGLKAISCRRYSRACRPFMFFILFPNPLL